MALAPGTRLGSYEIVAAIGAGGMGEVYRAHDARLGRGVAVKVLSHGFGEDRDRLRRFEQEAKSLAALSHPNILAIHDVGTHEGSPYLVMELLEGETLHARLSRGAIPVKRAVELALQLARGLAAAHDKGLIHRDLKPANLFLTKDGHLKILDFGLAKQAAPSGDQSQVPTQDAQSFTSEGLALGSVGYMSPEQVTGKPADVRSDIFAFGVVLYEMLSGRRAFERSSAFEALSATLKEDPPELKAPEGTIPLPLQRLVTHCLEKDPGRRFQTAQDLAFDLEAVQGEHPSAGATTDPARTLFKVRSRWTLPAAGLLALALLGALLVWSPWKSTAPAYDSRTVAILPFENRTGDPSLDNLGQQLVDLMRQDLQKVDNLKVAADAPGAPGLDPSRRLAEMSKAHFVAAGAYYLRNGEIEFQARLLDPWEGKVVYTLGPWQGPRADSAKAVAELRQGLAGAVAWAYEDRWNFGAGATTPPPLGAFLAYRRAWSLFGKDFPGCEAALGEALALEPGFFMARFLRFYSLRNHGEGDQAVPDLLRMEADFDRLTPVERILTRRARANEDGRWLEVLKAFDDLKAISPETYWLRYNRAIYELALNMPARAIRSLAGIPPSWNGEGSHLDQAPASFLCEAYHRAGRYEDQLRAARSNQKIFPNVLDFRMFEGQALAALGRLQDLEAILRELPKVARRMETVSPLEVKENLVVELRAHGHPEAARRLGEGLLVDYQNLPKEARERARGNTATLLVRLDRGIEALEIYQALLGEEPGNMWYLGRVGALLARLGRVEEARKVDAELAAISKPHMYGENSFHRACIAAQLGERERALDLLGQAFGQGLNFGAFIHQDINLEPLHGYPPYEELIKPKD